MWNSDKPKRGLLLCCMLTVLMALFITTASADVDTNVVHVDLEDAIRLYTTVLKNEAEFFCADGGAFYEPVDGRYTLLHDYLNSFEMPYQIETFAVVDMDNDGIPEVVLELLHGNFLQVLHYDAGTVYGYIFPIRAMIDLKQDGTFGFSSGAADSGCAKLTFSVASYEYVEISSDSEAESVEWYDFSPENISAYLK